MKNPARRLLSSLLITAGALLGAACSDSRAAESAAHPEGQHTDEQETVAALADAPRAETADADAPLTDAPLSGPRVRLLDLAFEAASALPLHPHVKNRSRAQDGVVAASLELGQAARAFRYAGRIENWRRGAAYADVAFHCAQNGAVSEAERCLTLARQVAESPLAEGLEEGGVESPQAWRKDRIRAKIARTFVWLGREQEAEPFLRDLEDSESGAVEVARAMRTEAGGFEQRLQALDAILATGTFDRIRAALTALAELHQRFYADEAKRTQLETRIRGATEKVPTTVRIEALAGLAEGALANGDHARALLATRDARTLLEGSRWSALTHLALAARLGALRFRAGEEEAGRAEVQAARARYARERASIVDIYRAGVLRPLAEACLALGDADAARALYAEAIEAGVANPNSRPRAEDLAATCCSMALHAFEPDEALWARLHEVGAALGEPW